LCYIIIRYLNPVYARTQSTHLTSMEEFSKQTSITNSALDEDTMGKQAIK
jgi:hypothetical protein